ncbi:MAG: hypothetical protein BGO43_15525 [Gammaproteobacteria bacterium 39-13]|nr:hypothetical protein [Gammaproteobacteria bacterium]OJV87821.1 MAG: hypothetical protein BGO43_15525 [Gammaproteobacteria bacterium 39-13]
MMNLIYKVVRPRFCFLLAGLILYVFYLTTYAAQEAKSEPSVVGHVHASEPDISSTFGQSLATKTSIPVKNNHFLVDSNVKEIQILLTTNAPQTVQILSPGGKTFMPFKKGENYVWDRIENLYAIKIPTPTEGQWEIQGTLLAEPQVLITSDLDMIIPSFPNNMIRGENLTLMGYLQEKGQRLTNSDFLKQTQFIARFNNVATNDVYKIYLIPKANGIYRYDYHFELLPGVYRLDIEAIGLLFQRERQQQFYMYDYPGIVSSKLSKFGDEMNIQVFLFSPLLEIGTCELSVLIHRTDGSFESMPIKKSSDGDWKIDVPVDESIDILSIIMVGYTKDARQVEVTFPKIDVAQFFRASQVESRQINDAKSKKFWRELFEQQVAHVIPVTQEKINEWILEDISPFKGTELMPLSEYPTYNQTLLDAWEPIIFPKNNEAEENQESLPLVAKAPIQAKSSTQMTTQQVAKPAPMPHTTSPKRKLLIGIFIALAILFLICLVMTIWFLLSPQSAKREADTKDAEKEAAKEVTMTEAEKIEATVAEELKVQAQDEIKIAPPTIEALEAVTQETKAETTEEMKVGSSDEAKAEASDKVKAESMDETKMGATDEVKAESMDETKAGAADEVNAEVADATKEGSLDKAKTESIDEVSAGSTEEANVEASNIAEEENSEEMVVETTEEDLTQTTEDAIDELSGFQEIKIDLDKEIQEDESKTIDETADPIPTNPSATDESSAEKSDGV